MTGLVDAKVTQGLLSDYYVPPLGEIVGTKRLVKLDRRFVPVQDIQTDCVMTLFSCNLGDSTYQGLAHSVTTKGLSHEEVLKERTRTCPSGKRGKEDRKTSRLSILLRNNSAEYRARTKAVTP